MYNDAILSFFTYLGTRPDLPDSMPHQPQQWGTWGGTREAATASNRWRGAWGGRRRKRNRGVLGQVKLSPRDIRGMWYLICLTSLLYELFL
jgi:hypothetical protein